jgi:hypothetical protein
MSIKEFIDKATGMWVTTQKCQVGDTLLITSQPTIDNQSFPNKTYLVMDVKLERTNEPLKLRLSGQQARNLAPIFTDNASAWINKRVRIAAKQEYPGLGKSGFIYIPS